MLVFPSMSLSSHLNKRNSTVLLTNKPDYTKKYNQDYLLAHSKKIR